MAASPSNLEVPADYLYQVGCGSQVQPPLFLHSIYIKAAQAWLSSAHPLPSRYPVSQLSQVLHRITTQFELSTMFIPFVTSRPKSKRIERRKGGGGGGKSSGSSSTGGSGSSTSSSKSGSGTTSSGSGTSTSGSGKTTTVPLSTSTAGGKSSASAYGSGGGSTIVIPSGQLFAGRSAGGGSRSQVLGTRWVS